MVIISENMEYQNCAKCFQEKFQFPHYRKLLFSAARKKKNFVAKMQLENDNIFGKNRKSKLRKMLPGKISISILPKITIFRSKKKEKFCSKEIVEKN